MTAGNIHEPCEGGTSLVGPAFMLTAIRNNK